jgi:tol-pal system protein YbgF
MKTLRGLAPAALAALLVAGCGSTLLPDRGTSDVEVRELKQRMVQLQREAVVTKEELEYLRRRIQELEAQLDGRSTGTTGRAAERRAATTPPPARRSEPIRDLDPPPAPSRNSGDGALLEEVDIEEELEPAPPRRPQLPERVEPQPEVTQTRPLSETTPTVVDQPVTTAAQTLYDQGYTLYHQGRYAESEETFDRFLREHPSTDLGDNALYWIGESRYARGDVEGALSAFRDTVVRYPDGNKVPDALLKAAQALSALGDDEASRETYREVVARYPGSAAAAVAEDRLN